MKKIVLSGINFNSGGPLSVMRDVLLYLSLNKSQEYKIIALVHEKKIYSDIKNIEYIEIKESKKSWIKRIYYEYFYLKKLSKEINPFLWLSMHDMTPNVIAKKRAVYCHNASPFYKMSKLEKKRDKKLRLFNLFYKYLYRINIKKNDFIIVQQDWLREEFKKLYNIKNIIVAYPNIEVNKKEYKNKEKNKKIFFYAAFPRVFKNFEIICETAKYFQNRRDIEFVITISGKENKYSKYLFDRYKDVKTLKFIGLISRDEVFEYYNNSEALIFPSKLETWGLPITEYKEFNKPIFLSDLKYARETIGKYDKVSFFNPYNKKELINKIEKYLEKTLKFEKTKIRKVEKPFTENWEELFRLLLEENK